MVGINTAIIQNSQSVGFALSIDSVKPLIRDIEDGKGTIDGDILNERVIKVLSKTEKMLLEYSHRIGNDGLSDHVLDAVGLGLFALGRAGVAMEI